LSSRKVFLFSNASAVGCTAPVTSVTRETSVDLDGGVSGSRMRTRYTVDNRFTIEG